MSKNNTNRNQNSIGFKSPVANQTKVGTNFLKRFSNNFQDDYEFKKEPVALKSVKKVSKEATTRPEFIDNKESKWSSS